LDRLARGERFDVALVDTAMPGMDGWTLLTRLRAMEETARMPIALMAGVLDPVDPAKLAKAPIQGFLKKPIELRELGDRVKALLVTPVVLTPSPFSTVPATPAKDLVKRAEQALPELRPEAVAAPAGLVESDLNLAAIEEDLLVLTADDIWPEEALLEVPVEAPREALPTLPDIDLAAPVLPDVHLELEELDLDSLQDLTTEPLPAEPVVSAAAEAPLTFAPEPVLADDDDDLVTLSGLEDLENFSAEFPMAPPPEPLVAPVAAPGAPSDDVFADLPDAADLLDLDAPEPVGSLITMESVPEFHESIPEPIAVIPEAPVEAAILEPALAAAVLASPAAGGPAPAVPGQVAAPVEVPTSVSSEQARAMVQALLADPVLVDALVKAVVSRMGDQVLREIAWEVMPDLAGRLQQ
jgi:CheY-like chemotaxis protein